MGNIQFTENGILFTATGIAFSPDCCCFEVGTNCTECNVEDNTPLKMTVVISDWVFECTACYEDAGTGDWVRVTWTEDPGIINGEHVLLQTGGDSCIWTKSVNTTATNEFSYHRYANEADCNNQEDETESLTFGSDGGFIFKLVLSGGVFTFTVIYTGADNQTLNFFSGTATSDDCENPPVISNGLSCSAAFVAGNLVFNMGTQGDATIAAGDQT